MEAEPPDDEIVTPTSPAGSGAAAARSLQAKDESARRSSMPAAAVTESPDAELLMTSSFTLPADGKKILRSRSKMQLPENRQTNKRCTTIEARVNSGMGEDDEVEDSLALFEVKVHPAQEAIERQFSKQVTEQSDGAGDRTASKLVSIWGRTTEKDVFQPYFSHKAMNFDSSEGSGHLEHCVGVLCQRGFKPDQPNQDDCLVLGSPDWMFFGVFDGHGPLGHQVSHFVQERLPKHIMERVLSGKLDWGGASTEAFQAVTEELKKELKTESHSSGTTTSVALLQKASEGVQSLKVAHVGDSSIVYGFKQAGESSWEAMELTDPHKPDRADELDRIQRCGGRVQMPGEDEPDGVPRLICPSAEIAMSRSMGDFQAASVGLVSEAEIGKEVLLQECDEHIILACSDGVWDVVPPLQAIQICSKFKPDDAQKAADKLVSKAQVRWQEMTGDCVDDITAILVRPIFGKAETKVVGKASAS